jgi:CheY-like chemotaxis protein
MAKLDAEPFDVIVSDLGLPDGSGYDLMRQVRQTRRIPGIAISGYGMEEDIQKSFASGFGNHLLKPIRIEQLDQAIRQVVRMPATSKNE